MSHQQQPFRKIFARKFSDLSERKKNPTFKFKYLFSIVAKVEKACFKIPTLEMIVKRIF